MTFRTINGTTYGPVGRDPRLIPGMTLINLGRVMVGPEDTATLEVEGYVSEIDDKVVNKHLRVYLDPSTGITPQIIQTEPLKMAIIILVVNLEAALGHTGQTFLT